MESNTVLERFNLNPFSNGLHSMSIIIKKASMNLWASRWVAGEIETLRHTFLRGTVHTIASDNLVPFLLTWFNFNPGMDE